MFNDLTSENNKIHDLGTPNKQTHNIGSLRRCISVCGQKLYVLHEYEDTIY